MCTEGERRGKNKESKTTEPKNIYWFIQHRSSSHFIVLSSFESFNGATPVVGFFLRVIKLNSRPFHTYMRTASLNVHVCIKFRVLLFSESFLDKRCFSNISVNKLNKSD